MPLPTALPLGLHVPFEILSAVVAAAYFAYAGYLGLLALLAKETKSRATRDDAITQFDVIIPAHNEQDGIAHTIESVRALDYPVAQFRIVVVADNCTDDTAQLARASGAIVLERTDVLNRGKGYALNYAFEASLLDGRADAVVVIDADSSVSANLLRACDGALRAGNDVLQARHGVRNATESWRSRLINLGFTLIHDVRSLARERMHLSCGLRGNGMCFRLDTLKRVPHTAFSIVEDLEYGIMLGLTGVRVAYVHDAWVRGDMPTTTAASRSQRIRWEGGRKTVAKMYSGPLLAQALRNRSAMALDLLLELMIPPLSAMVLAGVCGLALSLGVAYWGGWTPVAAWFWSAGLLALVAYVLKGCALTGNFLRAICDLAWAPLYMMWRVVVKLLPSHARDSEWVRTSREPLGKEGL